MLIGDYLDIEVLEKLFKMQMNYAYLFLFVIESLLSNTVGIKWLALATVDLQPPRQEDDCNALTGLARRQVKICRRNMEKMGAVREAAYLSINECQFQFRHRRWNCSLIHPKSVFSAPLNHGTREAAFVHALSAAGVAYSVTRACSSGNSPGKCGCDRSVHGSDAREGFKWAGCSDNIGYGVTFSAKFVDAREKVHGKHLVKGLVNLHNNRAGRVLIKNNMRINCKCHGVSGSCELKMCWRAMPSFREIGDKLKDKFDGATEVRHEKKGSSYSLVGLGEKTGFKVHSDEDLVYIQNSPDFCEPNSKTGAMGTKGRLCNRNSRGIDGCELLCCGRGYETRTRVVEERCRCKFQWCCKVECDTCKRVIDEHFCK